MRRAKLIKLSRDELMEQLRRDTRAVCHAFSEHEPGSPPTVEALIAFGKRLDQVIRARLFKHDDSA